jgi:hypothetical protein
MNLMRRQRSTQDRVDHKRVGKNSARSPDFRIKKGIKHRKTGNATPRKPENTISMTISKQPSAHSEDVQMNFWECF